MQDRQLYEQILGIEFPWRVERVQLNLKQGEVRVYLDHRPEETWKCVECGRPCALYDHQPERVWRHLDTCQYGTQLHASLPRTDCPDHGVKVVAVPWAQPQSRFTALFERLAIDWLKGRDKFEASQWREFCGLRRGELKTARAWALKEQVVRLWDYRSAGWARRHAEFD